MAGALGSWRPPVALRGGVAEMQAALLVVGGGLGRSRLVAAAKAAAGSGLMGRACGSRSRASSGRPSAAGPRVDVKRVGRAFTGRLLAMVARLPGRT